MEEQILGRYYIYWQLFKLACKAFYDVFLNHKEEKKMTDETQQPAQDTVHAVVDAVKDHAINAAENIAVNAASQVLHSPEVQSAINTAVSKAQLAVQQAMSSTLIHIELLAKNVGHEVVDNSSQLVDSLLQNMVSKIKKLRDVKTAAAKPKDNNTKPNGN